MSAAQPNSPDLANFLRGVDALPDEIEVRLPASCVDTVLDALRFALEGKPFESLPHCDQSGQLAIAHAALYDANRAASAETRKIWSAPVPRSAGRSRMDELLGRED